MYVGIRLLSYIVVVIVINSPLKQLFYSPKGIKLDLHSTCGCCAMQDAAVATVVTVVMHGSK